LVADQGSNDVATLFGSIVNGLWVAIPGPRLKSGGRGPIAVDVVSNPASPGGSDLLVTNGASGDLAVLPGVGQGFFNDQNPQVLSLPGAIAQPPALTGPSGSGVVAMADGQLVRFNLDSSMAATVFTPPAGAGVVAFQALANGRLAVVEQGGTVELLQ